MHLVNMYELRWLTHEAAKQMYCLELQLPGQARGGQRRKAPLDPRDLVRARRRPVQGDVGDPWPAAVELPELERPVAQAGAPSGGSRGGGGSLAAAIISWSRSSFDPMWR